MAAALKIRKGDVVQVISGKDRGKQGRILEAHPTEGRVIVENLNMVKKHRRARPMKDSSRMGQTQVQPGGVFDIAAPIDISNVMIVCPTCNRASRVGYELRDGGKGGRIRCGLKRADVGRCSIDDLDRDRDSDSAPEGPVRRRDSRAPQGAIRVPLDHGGPAGLEDHGEHGRRRGEDEHQGAGQRRRGADDDHRASGRRSAGHGSR